MKHRAKPGKTEFDPSGYPALREFFSGYLHEDFVEEYGSAAMAASAFRKDASKQELIELQNEWETLRNTLRGQPFSQLQSVLSRLGGAWQPAAESEVIGVDQILSRPCP